MEVILDELTPLEFFNHGGIVKVSIKDEDLIKECNLKKKYTFFDYKSYIKFFKDLYMTHIHNHQDENSYDLNKEVNAGVELNPSIGQSQYVVDLNYDHVRSYDLAKFYYSRDKRDPEVEPRDPYGIPNVCFSLVDQEDDRWEEYTKQRLERGFDISETWNLDGTIAKFIYPRLKVFIEDVKRVGCFPASMTFDEWLKILDDMLKGFELLVSDEIKNEDEDKIIEHSLDLFRKHFLSLWT
jgi:hypothetical protein